MLINVFILGHFCRFSVSIVSPATFHEGENIAVFDLDYRWKDEYMLALKSLEIL